MLPQRLVEPQQRAVGADCLPVGLRIDAAVAKLGLQDVGPVGKRIGSGTVPVHCLRSSGAACDFRGDRPLAAF